MLTCRREMFAFLRVSLRASPDGFPIRISLVARGDLTTSPLPAAEFVRVRVNAVWTLIDLTRIHWAALVVFPLISIMPRRVAARPVPAVRTCTCKHQLSYVYAHF